MLKKRCLNKRGFAVQFNWLFVLLGGAIIIGFFFSLIINQTSSEEKRIAQTSTQELDTLLKVSLAMEDTQKNITFDKRILFYCDDEVSEYSVEGAVKPARYDYNAIFSPNELWGEELIIRTLAFKAPFRVMPLVYVTNRDTEYVFIGTSTLITRINKSMPEAALKKFLNNIVNYPDNNYDHTVFVLNASDISILSSISFLVALSRFDNANERISAVVITPGTGIIFDYGELSFYYYNNSSPPEFLLDGTLPFLGEELIIGGVIAHNKTIYNCNVKKILRRLKLLSELHQDRISYYMPRAPNCGSYQEADNYLERIKDYADQQITFPLDNFKDLYLKINELKTLNNYLITSTDCPRIY